MACVLLWSVNIIKSSETESVSGERVFLIEYGQSKKAFSEMCEAAFSGIVTFLRRIHEENAKSSTDSIPDGIDTASRHVQLTKALFAIVLTFSGIFILLRL